MTNAILLSSAAITQPTPTGDDDMKTTVTLIPAQFATKKAVNVLLAQGGFVKVVR